MCELHKPCALVVIAPCTLIENWKREGDIVGFTSLDVKDLATAAKRTEALRRAGSSKCMIAASWAKVPTAATITSAFSSFVVVADEAHAMQTMTSIRTKNTLALCQNPACRGVILATGTPMKNGRPVNLYPLLAAVRHPISFNKMEYEKRYCNAKKTAFCAWDTSGVSNLAELKAKVGSSLLRKTKVSYLVASRLHMCHEPTEL
jgi:SNF2 family DNA or RNA helicase